MAVIIETYSYQGSRPPSHQEGLHYSRMTGPLPRQAGLSLAWWWGGLLGHGWGQGVAGMARSFGTLVLWIFTIWVLDCSGCYHMCHRLRGLNSDTYISLSGIWESKIQVLADWVSGEGSLPGWQMLSSWKESALVSPSLYKIMNPVPEGSTLIS